MQFRPDRAFFLKLIMGHPDIGALMSLCEENFVLLRRLAPGLNTYPNGQYLSRRPGVVDLHLGIEQQARYTTLVHLTHRFTDAETRETHFDPDARLRVYYDARQVEVLELRQSILPLRTRYAHPALADKWRANLFLSKWLMFCLRQGHGFAPNQSPIDGQRSPVAGASPACLAQSS
ncbi:DUF1249 domain-containing protein [Thermochromatium tepidum]|jgi:Uncharacterized protein conserved in bacteria|uniref:DUF1249 domain-containing protein n=1 Tax=Thermochromatium tepidum ATCC 43061 TaxID=316276 RepID=A0A6I6E8G4_THETI|nr:DUF1249 domain-containing protein [Thermochromatium tepidum]QGU32953.1 DUF1249 domain-containing protein [Thermochromatium tepidum ATCC 43061]